VPYFTKKLRQLSFIHYAHWGIVRSTSDNHQPHDADSECDYLLVASNFNGTWDEYIEVFSEVVPWRIWAIWTSCSDFPGPRPPERLKEYVRKNEVAASHYYTAYPEASTTLVLSALELRDRFDRFARGVSEGVASEDFHAAWRAFLTDVQAHL
jgi:hypothetical protein